MFNTAAYIIHYNPTNERIEESEDSVTYFKFCHLVLFESVCPSHRTVLFVKCVVMQYILVPHSPLSSGLCEPACLFQSVNYSSALPPAGCCLCVTEPN